MYEYFCLKLGYPWFELCPADLTYIHSINLHANRPLFQEFKTGISHMQVGNVFLLSYMCVCSFNIFSYRRWNGTWAREKTVPSWSITLSCNPFWVTAIRRYIRSRKRMGSCSRRDRIGRWKLIPNVEHYKYVSPNTKQPNRKQWYYTSAGSVMLGPLWVTVEIYTNWHFRSWGRSLEGPLIGG